MQEIFTSGSLKGEDNGKMVEIPQPRRENSRLYGENKHQPAVDGKPGLTDPVKGGVD